MKIKVSGVVCSFCAYGAKRNLSELEFLDKTYYGDDGILIDMDRQYISLAINPTKFIILPDITEAISSGGYEPIQIILKVSGKIDNKRVLFDKATGQRFKFETYQLLQIKSKTLYQLPIIVDKKK